MNESPMEPVNSLVRLNREKHLMTKYRASAKSDYDWLNDPALWRLFLKRLSGYDPDYDLEEICAFADALEIDPYRVWLKLKPTIKPLTATKH